METTIRIEQQSNGNNAVQVILDYDKGGWNYFNGNLDKRGYYLIVRPVKISDRGDCSTISFGIFDGRRFFIEETKRKSQKRMDNIYANINSEEIAKWYLAGELNKINDSLNFLKNGK